jgi:hypothetical protein
MYRQFPLYFTEYKFWFKQRETKEWYKCAETTFLRNFQVLYLPVWGG